MGDNVKYYKENAKYSSFLEAQDREIFQKYLKNLKRLTEVGSKVIDIGCGSGIVLEALHEAGRIVLGLEISETSAKICRGKGLDCVTYDGNDFPIVSNYYDLVGSFNVLEHTSDPEKFLNESLRVLRPDGYLVVACPNFLSITNGYHWHTRGLTRKIKNLGDITKRAVRSLPSFEKMPTVNRADFQPDDDACVVTNPQDIRKWARRKHLKLVEWSSQHVDRNTLANALDKGPIRILLGGCFLVFKKQQ